jgi:hypothetical protein
MVLKQKMRPPQNKTYHSFVTPKQFFRQRWFYFLRNRIIPIHSKAIPDLYGCMLLNRDFEFCRFISNRSTDPLAAFKESAHNHLFTTKYVRS